MSADQETEVIIRTSFFINSNGAKIFCRYWEPPDTPRALVFIAHGAVEHCNVYSTLAKLLASKNYYVFAHDHMGHGQSEGRRLGVNNFSIYVNDVFHHIELIKAKFTDLPIFLIAHSMGGAISIVANLKRPDYFKGTVLIGPAIALNPKLASSFKRGLLRLAARIFPRLPVAPADFRLACKSEEKCKMMAEDPYVYKGFLTVEYLYVIHQIMREVYNNLTFTDFPFILLQGEYDKLCHVSGAEEMYELSPSKDKSIKIYPKAYHSLLHEPDGVAEETTQEIVNWLEKR